ncbi:MAG: hypothetical protein H6667_21445 [Ardenticatenaceae bacterium]|nr:hypothetical protein [Ardenticatenaceae bacterium]MCB9446665.1 hypothetical protein [Ardenticatenaceae bacterium]
MRVMRTCLLAMIILGLTLALAGEPVHTAPQAVTMTVSNPYCVQDVETAGSCLINLRYFYAYTADSSFNHIEIAIDGKVRAHMNGFFENSAYLTGPMLGNGLKVACGGKNVSGIPDMGRQYAVTLTGFATGSSPVVDIANVTCPYYQGKTYLPLLTK